MERPCTQRLQLGLGIGAERGVLDSGVGSAPLSEEPRLLHLYLPNKVGRPSIWEGWSLRRQPQQQPCPWSHPVIVPGSSYPAVSSAVSRAEGTTPSFTTPRALYLLFLCCPLLCHHCVSQQWDLFSFPSHTTPQLIFLDTCHWRVFLSLVTLSNAARNNHPTFPATSWPLSSESLILHGAYSTASSTLIFPRFWGEAHSSRRHFATDTIPTVASPGEASPSTGESLGNPCHP